MIMEDCSRQIAERCSGATKYIRWTAQVMWNELMIMKTRKLNGKLFRPDFLTSVVIIK